jgi:hypothetical protein
LDGQALRFRNGSVVRGRPYLPENHHCLGARAIARRANCWEWRREDHAQLRQDHRDSFYRVGGSACLAARRLLAPCPWAQDGPEPREPAASTPPHCTPILPHGSGGVISGSGLGYLIGCSAMGLKGQWLLRALLAVAIVALAGCATGPYAGDPCGGFFACTGWH